jgi:hypothetical protein
MMIEGSGSIPLTSGSGSGSWRPKNMWIRWIRIRNTAGGKFATGVNDTGGKFAAGVKSHPVANNEDNIRLLRPSSELEGKNLYIC